MRISRVKSPSKFFSGKEGFAVCHVNSAPELTVDQKRRALNVIGVEQNKNPKSSDKLSISKIISSSERLMLPDIWDTTLPITTFSNEKRVELAHFFREVASRAPHGSAQWGFNIARARFFEGLGPSPGRSAVEFARREGLPIARWPRGSRRRVGNKSSVDTTLGVKAWQLRLA